MYICIYVYMYICAPAAFRPPPGVYMIFPHPPWVVGQLTVLPALQLFGAKKMVGQHGHCILVSDKYSDDVKCEVPVLCISPCAPQIRKCHCE